MFDIVLFLNIGGGQAQVFRADQAGGGTRRRQSRVLAGE